MTKSRKRISTYEMSETVAKLKKHFNSSAFTFRDAYKYLPEIDQRRLVSIIGKAEYAGFIKVIAKESVNSYGHKKAVNVYSIPNKLETTGTHIMKIAIKSVERKS